MKLGVIGWSGHANAGDERMLHCILRFFHGAEFLITSSWDDARERLAELNRCDFVLIGGGGLILRGANAHVDIIDRLLAPHGYFGISVEACHKDMAAFFDVMKQKSRFILVRDSQSAKYLDRHPKVIEGPDLTFLEPYPVAESVPDDACALSLRDWFLWRAQLHGQLHKQMKRMQARVPYLERFYPLRKWQPHKIVAVVRASFARTVAWPLYFEKGVVNDVDVLRRYYTFLPDAFDADLICSVRYVIAMRFHAAVFAIQRGIPFLSLSYQPKNKVLCADIGLPAVSVDIYTPRRLPKAIDEMKANYHSLRQQLLEVRERYSEDIRRTATFLRSEYGLHR